MKTSVRTPLGRGRMFRKKIEAAFRFLVTEFNYEPPKCRYEGQKTRDDYRVTISYLSLRKHLQINFGIELISCVAGISVYDLLTAVPGKSFSLYGDKDMGVGIDLGSYVEMISGTNGLDALLPPPAIKISSREFNRRNAVRCNSIDHHLDDIIHVFVEWIRYRAVHIVQGDRSEFPATHKFTDEQVSKLLGE